MPNDSRGPDAALYKALSDMTNAAIRLYSPQNHIRLEGSIGVATLEGNGWTVVPRAQWDALQEVLMMWGASPSVSRDTPDLHEAVRVARLVIAAARNSQIDLAWHRAAVQAETLLAELVSGGESLTPEPDEWERLRADADRHEVGSPPRGEPEPRLPERFVALRPKGDVFDFAGALRERIARLTDDEIYFFFNQPELSPEIFVPRWRAALEKLLTTEEQR